MIFQRLGVGVCVRESELLHGNNEEQLDEAVHLSAVVAEKPATCENTCLLLAFPFLSPFYGSCFFSAATLAGVLMYV